MSPSLKKCPQDVSVVPSPGLPPPRRLAPRSHRSCHRGRWHLGDDDDDGDDGHQDANVLGGKSDKSGGQDGEEGEDQASAQGRHPEDIFSVKET